MSKYSKYCPECNEELVHRNGCVECPICGDSACE